MNYATWRWSMSYTTLKTNAATRENTHSRYLRVAPAADSLEREAESAAENVMSGQVNGLSWSLSRVSVNDPVQRKCSCGGSTGAEGECEECKEKNQPLNTDRDDCQHKECSVHEQAPYVSGERILLSLSGDLKFPTTATLG